MKSYLFNEETLIKKNKYGIPEPINGKEFKKNIDVIFVPLLAYDKYGNRVGYGKGFYDRFLTTEQARNVIKVGLSFFDPEDKIRTSKYDEKLDFCVTPKKVFSF